MHHGAGHDTTLCRQNLQRNWSIVPCSQEYLPTIMDMNQSPENKDDRNAQTTRAYLWSKFDFVRCYHPILQFYLKSTRYSEISQNVWEELPFPRAVQEVVKAPLKWHDYCHDTTSILICARWVQSDARVTHLLSLLNTSPQPLMVVFKMVQCLIQFWLIGCLCNVILCLPCMSI